MTEFSLQQKQALAIASARARAGGSISQEEPSFLQRMGGKIQGRMDAVKNAPDAANKAISAARYVVGAPTDIGMAALESLTPEPVKQALGSAVKAVGSIPTSDGKTTFGDVGNAAVGAADRLAKKYPTAANLLGLGGEAMVAAPMAKPLAATTEVGVKVGTKAAPMVADAAVATGKAVAKAPAAAGKAVASTLAPNIPKRTAELVKRANDWDIELRADQYAPSKVRNTIQKSSQEIPFSGVDASEELNKLKWNKGIAKEIGQDADNLGPETIKKFLADSSSKFNSSVGTGDFKIVGKDFNAIHAIEKSLPENVTEDIAKIVRVHTRKFKADLKPQSVNKTVGAGVDPFSGQRLTKDVKVPQGPVISATKLASLRSDLVAKLPKINSLAREHVSDIIDIIDGIAERNITGAQLETLKQARKEWRNFKTIEPLLEKSTDGLINPVELMNRVASSKYIKNSRSVVGEDGLVDLARIGKKFLAKKAGSDSVHKALVYGGPAAFTAGMMTSPLTTLATTVGVPLANRGFQAINKSKTIRDIAITKGLKK